MRKAFTLIELLVVLAIGAILLAIIYPIFAQATGMKKQQQIDKLQGCENPQFVQVIQNTHGYSGNIRTDNKYLYKCQDGHMVELDNPI